jgi:hypothetical protein
VGHRFPPPVAGKSLDVDFPLRVGYAVAAIRLFQMEKARKSVLGTVSEALGATLANLGKGIRANDSPPPLQFQYKGLTKNDKDIFDGYAAGMNSRMATQIMSRPVTGTREIGTGWVRGRSIGSKPSSMS